MLNMSRDASFWRSFTSSSLHTCVSLEVYRQAGRHHVECCPKLYVRVTEDGGRHAGHEASGGNRTVMKNGSVIVT